jgi:hypothetical protein
MGSLENLQQASNFFRHWANSPFVNGNISSQYGAKRSGGEAWFGAMDRWYGNNSEGK